MRMHFGSIGSGVVWLHSRHLPLTVCSAAVRMALHMMLDTKQACWRRKKHTCFLLGISNVLLQQEP